MALWPRLSSPQFLTVPGLPTRSRSCLPRSSLLVCLDSSPLLFSLSRSPSLASLPVSLIVVPVSPNQEPGQATTVQHRHAWPSSPHLRHRWPRQFQDPKLPGSQAPKLRGPQGSNQSPTARLPAAWLWPFSLSSLPLKPCGFASIRDWLCFPVKMRPLPGLVMPNSRSISGGGLPTLGRIN